MDLGVGRCMGWETKGSGESSKKERLEEAITFRVSGGGLNFHTFPIDHYGYRDTRPLGRFLLAAAEPARLFA
jgi:hypothetical protein